ncbi:MAG: hypothetical protein Q9160_005288 [Pyrenula sp. 1 TL-2023]
MPFDPLTATIFELQQRLDNNGVTSVQLVQSYFEQMDKYEEYLHALISRPPRANVLQLAQKLDHERSAGNVRGPLHGIPLLIKELSFFKGSRLDCGWSALGGQTESAYVQGGFRADDSFAGHSNPAGSSSGSVVGVTAGYAPASLGTETEGSLIIPASRGALYTLKPTLTIFPSSGIIPVTKLFDSAGPMTKTPKDLAIMLDVIVDTNKTEVPSGGYISAVSGEWDGLRIGSLNPDIWTFPADARKSEPAAEQQMVVQGNPQQDKLEDAQKISLDAQEVERLVSHMRTIARTQGIDATFERHDINILIGPAESSMAQFAAGADSKASQPGTGN